jgi:hypothetical protein
MDIRTAQSKLWPMHGRRRAPRRARGPRAHVRVVACLAQQWSPEQRAACEPDAMRLCQQYVPDVGRTRACMIQYRRYLSPRCRAVIEGGRRGRR